MMTKKEAAEILLARPKLEACKHCDHGVYERKRYWWYTPGDVEAEGTEAVWCGACDGYGVVLPSEVYEAHGVLDLPLPDVPIQLGGPPGCSISMLRDLMESSYRNKYG